MITVALNGGWLGKNATMADADQLWKAVHSAIMKVALVHEDVDVCIYAQTSVNRAGVIVYCSSDRDSVKEAITKAAAAVKRSLRKKNKKP